MFQFASDRSGSTLSGLLVVRALQSLGLRVSVAFAHPGPMIEAYRDVGCDTHLVPHRNWLRRVSSARFVKDVVSELRASRAAVELVRRLNPSVGYVNTMASFSGAVAFARCRVPFVWHLRELFDDVGQQIRLQGWNRGGRFWK